MYIYLLIIIFLISPSISEIYAPMSKKTFEFDVEDICLYQNRDSDYIYVEPCEKGYKCVSIFDTPTPTYPIINICQEYSEAAISFGSSCDTENGNNDCEGDLHCVNNICTVNENESPYIYNNKYYYCPDDLILIYDSITPSYTCVKREEHALDGFCKKNGQSVLAFPDYNKICGKITLDEENDNTYISTSVNSIGSVNDGDFVYDEKACKSGFALSFYDDGTISGSTNIYKKCVQFSGYEKKGDLCNIKYILDKKTYNYDVTKVPDDLITPDFSTKDNFCESFKFIKTKLELFKQYVDKAKELADECKKKKYYDEPFTCKNDELRKLLYFYNNVEKYLMYKNEEEVIEFLLQEEYYDYGVSFSKTDDSKFMRLNFISLLLIIAFIFL